MNGATLSANLVWTHTTENSISELPFGTRLDCAGLFGFPCNSAADGLTYPEDRAWLNVAYNAGDLGVYLDLRWIGGTDNAELFVPDFLGAPPTDLVITEVGSQAYVDLGIGYDFTDRIRARLNVSNLFDKDAPLYADAVVSNNTDTRTYDIFGRSYALTLSLSF